MVAEQENRQALLASVRRVVVKLGTRTVTVRDNALDMAMMARLSEDVALLRQRGIQVVIVSSGAVGAGMGRLGLKARPRRLPELQATAAVGQVLLMDAYTQAFQAHALSVGQVLLTSDDLDIRPRYVNARNTLDQLLHYGAVPIVNENDSVAVEELQLSVGENDRLAALVSHLVDAHLTVLMTDEDGLFTGDPKRDPDAVRIPFARGVSEALYAHVGGAGSAVSRGGMRTKLRAVETVLQGGRMALITNGKTCGLADALAGADVGTLFVPGAPGLNNREIWMAHSRKRGVIVVDDGAVEAVVRRGKSLLPSGIVAVVGDFEAGDLVGIEDQHQVEIARGLVHYCAEDVQKIRGQKMSQVAGILNVDAGAEVIHRDHMVVF